MKKIFALLLTVCSTLACFTACDIPVDSSCEHTYEWVGSEGGHQKVYTCGCEYPDIVELHSDNNSDYVCDVCGWSMAEMLPEEAYLLIQAYEEKYPQAGKTSLLRYCGTYESGAIVAMLAGSNENFDCALWTETVADYDFNYSDGNRIRVLYEGEFYTLTSAYENGYLTKENIADIHIKWDGKLPELGYSYLYEFENWIYNLTVDDVKEIKTTTEFIGVAPGRFKDSQRTTDKAAIADVINDYKSIIMTSVAREDAEIEGGGAFTIEFILANGDVQKIYFNNGIYDGNVTKPELSLLQYYRVANIPTLEKYSNVKNSYSFITYRSTFELFTVDGEKVGEFYGVDKFEFVERGETEIPDGETAIPPEDPTHYIVGDIGTMYICSDKVFYMVNNGQRTYYELVGELHFDELDDYAYDLVAEYIFLLIDGLKMSDIEKIETVEYAGSVAPNIRKPIEYKTSTLETDIESVYNWLSTLKENVTKIPDEDAMLAGNSVTEMYVYTPNNNCFKVSDVGCNYLHFYGAYYEQESKMPEIVGEMVTYKFESYYDEAELYINDEKVKDYTFDFDKLICIEKDFETSGNPYKLVASIGSLYLYDEKHFIRNDIKYEIVGEFDFSQIFTDFPINGEKDLLYKVTIVDKYNEFYDKPTEEYFEAGTIITLHCYPIMDADLVMYINGERVGIQNAVEGADGYYIWEYSFVVPAEDITITFQMSGGM
ncbi:MAG: hypothetical protein J6A63_08695 [Clostridia bacterium]|nr:hypothetical protein [Clostridia bacterium]